MPIRLCREERDGIMDQRDGWLHVRCFFEELLAPAQGLSLTTEASRVRVKACFYQSLAQRPRVVHRLMAGE